MAEQKARISLQVEGIVCTGCATDMETVLSETDGILDVTVSYAAGTVVIDYAPDEINQETLLAKVNGFGMKARIADHQ
jgi:copper chaperone CopZ